MWVDTLRADRAINSLTELGRAERESGKAEGLWLAVEDANDRKKLARQELRLPGYRRHPDTWV